MWPFENDEYPEGYLLPEDFSGPNEGSSGYGRRHGAAILHYRFGRPYAADNVRLPDGTRGRVCATHINRKDWRRPLNDHERAWSSAAVAIPIHWRWGALIVAPDDLIFEDNQSPSPIHFSEDNERLDRDLYRSQEIRELAVRMEGCNSLYRLLVYGFWQQHPDEDPLTYTHDEAATTLAAIRGLGETHYDLANAHWLGYPGGEDQLMRRHLERHGWYDLRDQPTATLVPASRPAAPEGVSELLRRWALFVVASVLAFHILLVVVVLFDR